MTDDALIDEADYIKNHYRQILKQHEAQVDKLVVLEAHTWKGRRSLAWKLLKCVLRVLRSGSTSILIKKMP